MRSSQLHLLNPLTWQDLKECLHPKLTEDEICALETVNLWMANRIAGLVFVVVSGILSFRLLLGRTALQYGELISLTVCLFVCALTALITGTWQKQGRVPCRRIQILTEALYWGLSLWGMLCSLYHYVAGEQMQVFDAVQICFALMLNCHPIHAVLHFVMAYGGFFLVLMRVDGAARVGAGFFAMGALILGANLLHFWKELLNIRLQESQRDRIQDLECVSRHDGLTGLRNRHALRQDFPDYVGKTVWVVMADIDLFKHYNDTYGHGEGDRLLTAIGESIREKFGTQTTYRYGGDEFLIVVEEEEAASVREKLKRWREEVSAIAVEPETERGRLWCSYGMSGGYVGSEAELRAHIRCADEKLYEAKGNR